MGIVDSIRRMTFSLPVSGRLPVRGNIVSAGGSHLNRFENIDTSLLDYYLDVVSELREYEKDTFVQGVLRIITTPMLSSMKGSGIIKIATTDKKYMLVKSLMEEYDLPTQIRNNLYKIIYYGSHNIAISHKARVLSTKDLYIPEINISRVVDKSVTNFIMTNKSNFLKTDNILRIGKCDLSLSPGSYDLGLPDDDTETIFNHAGLRTACPLFYYLVEPLKEYIYLSKLVKIIMLRELLVPTIYTMNTNSTDQDVAVELAQRIERLCNAAGDTALTLAASTDISQLYDQLMSKVRIIPDFQGVMQSQLSEFDPSKLDDKLSKIIESLPDQRSNLLSAIGIPEDLYDGKVTRWDTSSNTDRLDNLIDSYQVSIDESLNNMFYLIFTMIHKSVPDRSLYNCSLFDASSLSYKKDINKFNSLHEYLESLNKLKDDLSSSDQLDDDKYDKLVRSTFNNLGLDILKNER